MHDACVFTNSDMYKKGRQGTLFTQWKKKTCGVQVYVELLKIKCMKHLMFQVPLVILGDPAYPALPWLM